MWKNVFIEGVEACYYLMFRYMQLLQLLHATAEMCLRLNFTEHNFYHCCFLEQ